jgi:hypothetical protein
MVIYREYRPYLDRECELGPAYRQRAYRRPEDDPIIRWAIALMDGTDFDALFRALDMTLRKKG